MPAWTVTALRATAPSVPLGGAAAATGAGPAEAFSHHRAPSGNEDGNAGRNHSATLAKTRPVQGSKSSSHHLVTPPPDRRPPTLPELERRPYLPLRLPL